jgi:hypothetical protein
MRLTLGVALLAMPFLVGNAQVLQAQVPDTCPDDCSDPYVSCSTVCYQSGAYTTCGALGYLCGCPHYTANTIDTRRVDLGIQCQNPAHPERNANAQQQWVIHEDQCDLEPNYYTCYFGDEFCSDPGTYEPAWCSFCGYGQNCPA